MKRVMMESGKDHRGHEGKVGGKPSYGLGTILLVTGNH